MPSRTRRARTPKRPTRIPSIPEARRIDVTRAEFNNVIEMLNRRGKVIQEYGDMLASIRQELDIQFRRIAQIQAELDDMKLSSGKLDTPE